MTLKQSDKIIAIVGVVILIVAAFAIIIYAPEDDESEERTPKTKTFEVTWVGQTGEMLISDGAYSTYTMPFTISAEPGSVITGVDIQITWQDDNTWGLITKGEDTLKADFTINGETKTHEETGSGDETLPFMIYDMPKVTKIEAKDIDEARGMLTQLEPNKYNATFDVDITVTVGESFKFLNPIRSLLNKRKDTGDNFDLKITYTYYTPSIEDTPMEPEDNDEETSRNNDYRLTGTNYLIGLGAIR